MKTVINLWHTGIAGTRLAHQFSERTRLIHDDDATELDDAEEVTRVVTLATKECKSLSRTLTDLRLRRGSTKLHQL